MTHLVTYPESSFDYWESKETNLLFTNDINFELHDLVIAQFGRKEINMVVNEILHDMPGMKKGWSVIVLNENKN